MNQIKINIPISFGEQNSLFSFENNEIELTFNLEDGKHIYRSTQIKIGTYHGLDLFLLLEIPYSYNTEAKEFIFADKNYKQEDLIKFHISNGGNNLISSVFTHNEYTNNESPLISTEHNSLLELKIDEIIEKISPVIISGLLKAGVRNVFKPSFAPKVTNENFNDLKGVLDEDLQNTTKNKFELQTRLNSMYDGIDNWIEDQNFVNVINSSRDPKDPYVNSWISLWKLETGNNNPTCTSFNTAAEYNSATHTYSLSPFTCNCNTGSIIGGHVIPEYVAREVPHSCQHQITNVWILPICKTHNNNDKFFMFVKDNLISNIPNYAQAVRLRYWE